MKGYFAAAAAFLAMAAVASVPAAANTFTTQSSFLAALAGTPTTANFDGDAAGTVILTGAGSGSADGITFGATVAGGDHELIITNIFDTTSGANYLGTTDGPTGGSLFGSDSITMTFGSTADGVGLYILGGNPFSAGTFQLCVGAVCALNSDTADTTLADGTLAYFIGLTTNTTFTSATISLVSPTGPGDGPLWNVDDITSDAAAPNGGGGGTVPEPASLILLVTGAGAIVRKHRK